jgi:hypothetical protein
VSAPVRTSLEAIKAALTETQGNVAHAAEMLRMSGRNLRIRLEVAGLQLDSFRPVERRTVLPLVPPPRMRAESTERLRQAAFDLAYIRRRETTASDVLQEFMAEAFDSWLATKLPAKGK